MVAQEGEYPMNGWVVVWCARVKLAYGHICMHAGIMQSVCPWSSADIRKEEGTRNEGRSDVCVDSPSKGHRCCVRLYVLEYACLEV